MPVREEAWPPGTPCWVDCQVDDPAKAGEFYAALFGWDVQGGGEDAGGYLMAMREGRAVAGIGPKPEAGVPSVWTTYFAVADADKSAEQVTAAGGKLLVPAFDVMEFGRMFVAADASGAPFAVWEARARRRGRPQRARLLRLERPAHRRFRGREELLRRRLRIHLHRIRRGEPAIRHLHPARRDRGRRRHQ